MHSTLRQQPSRDLIATTFLYLHFLAMVMNVQVERLNATSVRVSWEMINSAEITNYTVYYRAVCNTERQDGERSITIPINQNSVAIRNLLSNVTYYFQVAAVVQGRSSFNFTGQRSDAVSPASPPSPGEYSLPICIIEMSLLASPKLTKSTHNSTCIVFFSM